LVMHQGNLFILRWNVCSAFLPTLVPQVLHGTRGMVEAFGRLLEFMISASRVSKYGPYGYPSAESESVAPLLNVLLSTIQAVRERIRLYKAIRSNAKWLKPVGGGRDPVHR
jgi:hypothetical protein